MDRATPRHRDKAWGWFTWFTWFTWSTWVTLGYGYRPWLALLWLIGVAVASATLTAVLGVHGLYPKDHPDQRCVLSARVVIGIDNALPLVTTTSECLTRLPPNRSAQAPTWAGIGAQVGGWAFATLFVAGFTGAVQKT